MPCLYFGTDPGADGLASVDLDAPEAVRRVNARFVDLLLGYGETEIVYWRQKPGRATDWDALIAALDREAKPLHLDPGPLMEACPAGVAPLRAPSGGEVWDHPLLRRAPSGAIAIRSRIKAAYRRFGTRKARRA